MRNRYTILAEKYCTQVLCENVDQGDWPDQTGLIFTGKISPDGQSALYTTGPEQALNSYWFNKKGELHNNFGPAYFTNLYAWPNQKEWYVNGKRHRLDGPAVIQAYGRERDSIYKDYYIDDKEYSKEDYEK